MIAAWHSISTKPGSQCPHLRTCENLRLFLDRCILQIWFMRCVRASSVLRQQRKLASGFSIIQLSKYPLCVPILLGKVGFSAKMTVDRALGSAETSMPLRGDKLPEPCRLEARQEQCVAAFPFSSPLFGQHVRKHCTAWSVLAYGKCLMKPLYAMKQKSLEMATILVNYSIIWGKVRCHCIVSVGLGI